MKPLNPEWHSVAKCLEKEPAEFDTPLGIWTGRSSRENSEKLRESMCRAGAVCDGCQVMKECARDIRYQDVGVIRAGLALPDSQYRPFAYRAGLGTAIDMVAEGVNPSIAIAAVIARD